MRQVLRLSRPRRQRGNPLAHSLLSYSPAGSGSGAACPRSITDQVSFSPGIRPSKRLLSKQAVLVRPRRRQWLVPRDKSRLHRKQGVEQPRVLIDSWANGNIGPTTPVWGIRLPSSCFEANETELYGQFRPNWVEESPTCCPQVSRLRLSDIRKPRRCSSADWYTLISGKRIAAVPRHQRENGFPPGR
jgi:hypothetical protein